MQHSMLKQMEYEDREKRRNDRSLFYIMGIFMLLALFCFGMSYFWEQATMPAVDEVKLPFSASDLKGENYEQVVADLENAGFSDITVTKQEDLITGFLTKEGSVEKVSINGDSDYDKGDIFPEKAKVIVIYHTFKE